MEPRREGEEEDYHETHDAAIWKQTSKKLNKSKGQFEILAEGRNGTRNDVGGLFTGKGIGIERPLCQPVSFR